MFWIFGAQTKANRMAAAMPIADIKGSKPGSTLLVTAGLDGDEYISIEAAYRAAEAYRDGNFSGRLIILPIVNIPGFEAGVSHNPVDRKYPKYSIPGSSIGSPTQRLMNGVSRTYAYEAAMWLDLHNGAVGEAVIPCVWNAVTGIENVDAVGKNFCVHSSAVAAVREPATSGIKKLATKGCAYILAESEEVEQHQYYIARAMQQLGMLETALYPVPAPRLFNKSMAITEANKDAASTMPGSIVLWNKTTPPTAKEARLGEIAYDEVKM